jgi:anti-anti-sigma factor
MLTIETEERGEVTVVNVTGSVDGITAGDLLERLTSIFEQGRHQLVASLAGVDYTSSAGLRAVLTVMKEARTRGGDLRLAAVRPPVARVLDLAGFSGILKIFDDVDQAVGSFDA